MGPPPCLPGPLTILSHLGGPALLEEGDVLWMTEGETDPDLLHLTLGPPRGLVICGSPVCDPALFIDKVVLLEEHLEAPHEGVDEYLGELEPVLEVPAQLLQRVLVLQFLCLSIVH